MYRVPKYLPFVNFFLATASLGFQLAVLNPWHSVLSAAFTDLRATSQKQLADHIQHHNNQLTTIEGQLGGLINAFKVAGVKEADYKAIAQAPAPETDVHA